MRDVLLAAVIFGALPAILWRPQVGVLMWVWISVMNPHRLTWGFAYDFNFAAIVAGVTLVSAVLSKDLRRPPVNALMVAWTLFVAWMGVTTMFAFYPDDSFEKWKTLMKTQAMAFLIPMLFHKKEDLRWLIWVIVLSIGYFGTKGGAWVLITGGDNRVWGPPGSYIADNNAVAVAIIMVIPLMRYLQLTTTKAVARWALTGMMLLCGVAVLGTYSRGALLAALAAMLFLWWKSRHRRSMALVAAVAIPLAFSFMPGKWYERMDTIAEYDQDGSASARLNSWGTMLNIAKDRPFVGGGFEVAEQEVYARYAPDSRLPAYVAHSIYFQALGEHGFVGLALYLLLLRLLWSTANRIIRATSGRPSLTWARDLSSLTQVTVIGFAVGGAFLSLVNFDVPYYLVGSMVATHLVVQRECRAIPAPALEQPKNSRGKDPEVATT